MNKDRRKRLEDISMEIEEVFSSYVTALEPLRQKLEDVRNEESDYFDNMPENLQESESGSKSQEAIDNIDEALSTIDNITMSSDIDECSSFISKAVE